jgi:hypothetical protein
VWYPRAEKNDPGAGVYKDLVDLVHNAKPDDLILIRHDGLLEIPETTELRSRAGVEMRLTFKPFEGCKPVLTVPAVGNDLKIDQSLFRLTSGEVAFVGLQFRLKPPLLRSKFKVAAVSIVGGKGCSFTDCVFTLAEEDEKVAAVVSIENPGKLMAMSEVAGRAVPEVIFKHCIIRGKGRGIWIEDSSPARLEVSQSLTAIDGPLLLVEPAAKSVAGGRSSLKLNRVTVFVGGPIVVMHASKAMEMRATGLVPFDVHADECLFASVPFAGQPLIELDGIDPGEWKSVLKWEVKSANRYANFEEKDVVGIVRPGGDTIQKNWEWDDWFSNSGEPAGRPIGRITFALPPAGLRELAFIKPDDVQVKDFKFTVPDAKSDDAGANDGKLPTPWSWSEEVKQE